MENIQKIQDFLQNRLTEEEKNAFEKEMKEDSNLAQDVLLHQQLHQALAYSDAFKMQSMLKEIVAETPLKPDFEGYQSLIKTQKWWTNGRLGIFGLAIVAILAGSFWFYQNKTEHARLQAIAAPHWAEVFDYAVRIDDADVSNFAQGMKAYKSGNYVAAAQVFERHLAQQPDDGMTQLYLGIAYALSQQQEKAIENLLPLANHQSEWTTSAQWYLALCYLRDGNANAARQWLSNLKNDAIYAEKAQKVLNQL
ncbi:MAG: hypothetical protein JNL70_04275 [Saprospiraceae bacterium]|nr:hypothetical protein [Saprospiraceae bacterium]